MEQQQCTICMEEISNDTITPLPFFMGIVLQCGRPPVAVVCVPCADTQWMLWMNSVADLEPARPAGNRPPRAAEPHGFPSVAGEPRRPLRNNTRLSYCSTRLSQWLVGDQPARPLRLQWDKNLMFAASLMVVCLLCYFLTEQLMKPVVEFFFCVLVMHVIPITSLIDHLLGS